MGSDSLMARRLLAASLAASAAALLASCGSASTGSPSATVTPTQSPGTGPGTSPTSPATSAPAGSAECTTASLHVTVGSRQGAAGTIYYNIDFTNVSTTSCFMRGYPGASLVSAGSGAGSQVGADAKRTQVGAIRAVTIAPGQTAHAVLGITEAGNFPASKCQPVTVHWLKVFPPDQTVAAYAPLQTQTCASTSVPTLRINAIAAGA
jgi:Domain of unknown function (DUF4232)